MNFGLVDDFFQRSFEELCSDEIEIVSGGSGGGGGDLAMNSLYAAATGMLAIAGSSAYVGSSYMAISIAATIGVGLGAVAVGVGVVGGAYAAYMYFS